MQRLPTETDPTGRKAEFDSRWRHLTAQANLDLNQGELEAAGLAYDQAYHEARMIFAEAWNGHLKVQPHAAPMMIVSATNAAAQRRALGNEQAAQDQLVSALRIFTQALTSERAAKGLKRGCAEHLPRLIAEISKRQGEADDIVAEAKNAALGFWKTSAH
ncbi:MAG: hypothetical protein AAFZ91_10990 [Pseudomonadota bacterium]